MRQYIDIIKEVGGELLKVSSPARYVGGEEGRLAKKDATLQTIIAFPDMYEIGMSNNALKIIYNQLNKIDDVSCGRVFAVAPDFEKLLIEKNIPLYELDTGLTLKDSDILMFTLSYELGITGVLSILDTAKIPIRSENRNENDPIVIAGGPSVANPLPFQAFIDAFWIGEAEDGFFDLVLELKNKRKNGACKQELFDIIKEHPSVWVAGKKTVQRAVDSLFAEREPSVNIYPLPSMRIVQQHATVEIMRGCPNGCRFCFAGTWYKPMRQKSESTVRQEVSQYIAEGGFREISLSSLSSGDYKDIGHLVDVLNIDFADSHISFQLPSLHISTLSLEILEKISLVRKGGLTFAVETPLDAWQIAINKEISLEAVTKLILEAKKYGYKSAKFYFMIGLPLLNNEEEFNEEDAIISFILEAARITKMTFNINVGVFIPKPHTPFQWAPLIDTETANKKLFKILNALKRSPHKVSVHNSFTSYLEGIISRGDERVSKIIEEAYISGCRLDAWSEYFKKDNWLEVLDKNKDIVCEITGPKNIDDDLPWDFIKSRTSKNFLKNERKKALSRELSSPCIQKCTTNCGVCGEKLSIVENKIQVDNLYSVDKLEKCKNHCEKDHVKDGDTNRLIFSYSKEGSAVFLSHLAMIEVFTTAFLRSGIEICWTLGFNPIPKIDFAAPISVGVQGENEIALIDIKNETTFAEKINNFLPDGIKIKDSHFFTVKSGEKKYSLPALLWGFAYENGKNTDFVKSTDDKKYRALNFPDNFKLKRSMVLAKSVDTEYASYFDVYKKLYKTETMPE
jgi:radical SAM superfamily enzyme YgiQ (UPF0313 family)